MTEAVYFPSVYVSPARAAGLQVPFGPPRLLQGLSPDEVTAAAAEGGLIQTVPVAGEPGPDFQRRLAAARAWVAGLIEHGTLETVKHPTPPAPEPETTRSILADLKDYPKGPAAPTPGGPFVPPELTDPGAVLYLAAELERDWTGVQTGLAGAEARGRDMLQAALGETGLAESPGPAAAVPGPARFAPSEDLAVLWLDAWQRLWDEAGDWQTLFLTDVPGLTELIASRVSEVLFTSPTEVVMTPGLGPRPKRWFTVDLPDTSGLDRAGLDQFLAATTKARNALAQGLTELTDRAAAEPWSIELKADGQQQAATLAEELVSAGRPLWPGPTPMVLVHLDVFVFPGLGVREVFLTAVGRPPDDLPRPADWPDAWPTGAGVLFALRYPL